MYFIPSSDELIKELKANITREQAKLKHLEANEWKLNKYQLKEEMATVNGKLLAYKDSLAMVEAYLNNQQEEASSSAVVTEDSKEYLPLDTKFVWGQDTYPKEDCEVYLKRNDGYYLVEPVRTSTGKVNSVKVIATQEYIKLRSLEDFYFCGNPHPPEETTEEIVEPALSAKLVKDRMNRETLQITGEDTRLGGRQRIELLLEQTNVGDISYLIKQLEAIRTELESR